MPLAGPRAEVPPTGRFTLHGRPIDVLPDGKVLMDYRARIYDPQHARWLQRDSSGYADGPNLYEAFGANASRFKDPDGRDIWEEANGDLTYVAKYFWSGKVFMWTFGRNLGPNWVLIDHPQWPYAFIMDRATAKREIDDWYFWQSRHGSPLEIMQRVTALAVEEATDEAFRLIIDKRIGQWHEPCDLLYGESAQDIRELAKQGMLRQLGDAARLTAVSYSLTMGSLAAPAGAGAGVADIAATTLDLTSGEISPGQGVVVLGVAVAGALLHVRFADDMVPATGQAAPRKCVWSRGGFRVGRHAGMPSPRPTGHQSHHGVLDKWMRENYTQYLPDEAPTVLMVGDPRHNATRAVFNRWRADIARRQGVSCRNIDWQRVSKGEIWRLAEEQFDAAQVPCSVRNEYWRQFNEYLSSLE